MIVYYQKKNVIKVNALWDTGAMRSCISKCMALKLGLFPTDYSKAYGIGGENRTEVYDILVNLNSAVKNIPLQVSCGKLHRDDGGSPFSEIGFLVGMDIIGMGDFFTGLYAGENKVPCTMMSFRFPSALHPVDYLEDFGNRD